MSAVSVLLASACSSTSGAQQLSDLKGCLNRAVEVTNSGAASYDVIANVENGTARGREVVLGPVPARSKQSFDVPRAAKFLSLRNSLGADGQGHEGDLKFRYSCDDGASK